MCHRGIVYSLPLLLLLLPGTMAVGDAPRADITRQPRIDARKTSTLTVDGRTFKDSNKNGQLDKYEDWRLPVEARSADLIAKMTLAEKAGLMMHPSIAGFTGPGGIVLEAPVSPASIRGPSPDSRPRPPGDPARRLATRTSPSDLVTRLNVRWILLRSARGELPEASARWANTIQEIAEGSRLGIPAVFSSDPRHAVRRSRNGSPPTISQWPEQIGFGAIGDPKVVREFGRIASREYRALGLRVTLSPMADVATEPRWTRVPGTFGEDARLAGELVKAYIEGFQGRRFNQDSVMTVTKHWPGDGPVRGGIDPHHDSGRWQVYPGNNFDYHLIPFIRAFEAGTGGIMPGYSIPKEIDTVGMNFSKKIIGDLLRRKHNYDGLVLTNWLSESPWGVEHLSLKDRQRLILEAGCDQLGGESNPEHLIELVKDGSVPESRLNESVRRILRPMFQMGLFENPYVDPDLARTVVASKEFMEAGALGQRKSIVLLKNANKLLPLKGRPRLYVENMSRDTAAQYGELVAGPKDANVAIIKVSAPFPPRNAPALPNYEESLVFAGAGNARQLDSIRRIASTGTPTIVCIYLSRPAVLSEFIDDVAGVLAHFSAEDDALLDIIFGRFRPFGKLPFNLPRDMASVLKQKEDVPHDLEDPLFRLGFGLVFESESEGRPGSRVRK